MQIIHIVILLVYHLIKHKHTYTCTIMYHIIISEILFLYKNASPNILQRKSPREYSPSLPYHSLYFGFLNLVFPAVCTSLKSLIVCGEPFYLRVVSTLTYITVIYFIIMQKSELICSSSI